jgi:hypothetical protein
MKIQIIVKLHARITKNGNKAATKQFIKLKRVTPYGITP